MFKHLRIHVIILISFLLVLVIACGSIIIYNYHKSSRALLSKVDNEINTKTDYIIESALAYMAPAKFATKFIAWFSSHSNNIIEQTTDLSNKCIKMMELYPQISGFYNGDKQGDTVSVSRLQEGFSYPYSGKKYLPANAKFAVRIITRIGGTISEFQEFKDEDGRTLAVEERPPATEYYDPRVRPWYLDAQKVKGFVWTDPYIFLFDVGIGVTAATPVLSSTGEAQMVISADIPMAKISQALESKKISKNSIAFIMTSRGEIISYPTVNTVLKSLMGADGVPKSVPTYKDVDNPVLIQAFKKYKKTKESAFETVYQGTKYLVRFKDFGKSLNKDWFLGFIAPYSDFTADIEDMTRLMILFSAVIMVFAAGFIVILARNISRPIEKAAKDLLAIGSFHIDEYQETPSRFGEISMMNEALNRMKRNLKDFSRFVPKAVVTKLIESGSGATIGGKKSFVTIMFTDIKGFTSISEKMSSEKLIQHLSDYLNQLTVIIQEHQGTIDKYIGDAIMTFWGAPIADKEHAVHACGAALACKRRLDELNHTWELDGKPPLYTRFGVHTGDAIVGNVGSEDRLNYSAFGDNVNLASRLEGSNKYYDTTIIISHATYKEIRHKFICRPVDVVAVVGKTEGVRIYELLFEITEDVNEKLDAEEAQKFSDLTHAGFEHYINREWEKGIKKYKELAKAYPKDKVAKIFIKRCQEYKLHPPAEDWSGVYTLKSK
jgi:adenylate cyclase